METKEEKKMTLWQKLVVIQRVVSGLKKDGNGSGYQYVTGDKLLGELKPLMSEHSLLLKQEVLSIANERHDYKTSAGKEKNEILSSVMMRFTWIDAESGEREVCEWGANGMNSWDKGVGSAMTYGERYFLLKFFHIATDQDDIDSPNIRPDEPDPVKKFQPEKQKAVTPTITKDQQKDLDDISNHPLVTAHEQAWAKTNRLIATQAQAADYIKAVKPKLLQREKAEQDKREAV